MHTPEFEFSRQQLPDGTIAVPIHASFEAGPLRPCVLVSIGSGRPHLIAQEYQDRVVVEGCLIDHEGTIREWLLVTIQSAAGIVRRPDSPDLPGPSGTDLDRLWKATLEQSRAADQGRISSKWEFERPEPTWVDPKGRSPFHLSGWTVCTDDAVLAKVGLPLFGKSAHRYLWNPSKGAAAGFIAATPSPSHDALISFKSVLPEVESFIPLNIECGYMVMTAIPLASMGPIAFGRLLGGAPPDVWLAKSTTETRGVIAPRMSGEATVASALTARRPAAIRATEGLYLKLALLADAAAAVQGYLRKLNRPLLSLGDRSFRVAVTAPFGSLPALWTARVLLVDNGCARPVFTREGGLLGYRSFPQPAQNFRSLGPLREASPRPVLAGFRTPTPESEETISIEAVLSSADQYSDDLQLDCRPGEVPLALLRIGSGIDTLELVGHVRFDLGTEHWVFVSQPFKSSSEFLRDLISSDSIAATILVNPLYSSIADLSQIAALGVHLLLCNQQNQFSSASQDLKLLARAAATADGGKGSLAGRIASLLRESETRQRSLGSHNLAWNANAPRQLPDSLWCDVLAMLIRATPGWPGSTWSDNATGVIDNPAQVFDHLRSDLTDLLTVTRSMLGFENHANDIVRQAIDRVRKERGLIGNQKKQ